MQSATLIQDDPEALLTDSEQRVLQLEQQSLDQFALARDDVGCGLELAVVLTCELPDGEGGQRGTTLLDRFFDILCHGQL